MCRFYDASKIQNVLFNLWWINTLKFYFGLQQSLDDLKIIDKKTEGASHILLQYLNETSFTSTRKREQIFESFCRQILGYGELDDEQIKLFVDNYDSIIPIIDKERKKGAYRFMQNHKFLKLLTFLGSKGVSHVDLDQYPIPKHFYPEIQRYLITYLSDEHAYNSYVMSLKSLEWEISNSVDYKFLEKLDSEFESQLRLIHNTNIDSKGKNELYRLIKIDRQIINTKISPKRKSFRRGLRNNKR